MKVYEMKSHMKIFSFLMLLIKLHMVQSLCNLSLIFKQICQKLWSNYLTNYLINYLTANYLQSYTKYFTETIVFISNSGLHKKFSFCFSGDFIQYWQSFHSWRRNKQQALILCSFQIFLIFPYFLVLSRLASCKATHI